MPKDDWRQGGDGYVGFCHLNKLFVRVVYLSSFMRSSLVLQKRVIDRPKLVSIIFEFIIENERAKRARVVRHSLRAKG